MHLNERGLGIFWSLFTFNLILHPVGGEMEKNDQLQKVAQFNLASKSAGVIFPTLLL